jgi:hypothetical protein
VAKKTVQAFPAVQAAPPLAQGQQDPQFVAVQ